MFASMPNGTFDVDDHADRYRRTGEIAFRNRIVEEFSWLPDERARRFRFRGETWSDLQQVARIGLVNAADRYVPGVTAKFVSFAVPTIDGELRRHCRDRTWAVSVSRTYKDAQPLVAAVRGQLEQELGRQATPDEIANVAQLDVDLVRHTLLSAAAARTWLLDAPAEDRTTDSAIASATDDACDLRLDLVAMLHRLDARARLILYWVYFEERTQREIAQELGIGQVQVSRLLRGALATLRRTADGISTD